jgi:hypothetical protein
VVFSLREACELLPAVRGVTADAARQAEALADALDDLVADLRAVVDDWAVKIREMGLQAKGPWLVDFDNGEGYYCWQHPEPTLSHYHGYDEGFAGRMKIV